jgi:hypothetical protein
MAYLEVVVVAAAAAAAAGDDLWHWGRHVRLSYELNAFE